MNLNIYASPLNDYVFKQIFGEQRNIDNTRMFLQTLLDIPENEYGKLTVSNPILGKIFKKGKSGIVDVRLTTKSGKIILIELQVEKTADLKNRILYYVSRQFSDQLRSGYNFNKLHQVISIVICDHNLLEEEKSYINEYMLRNDKNKFFTNMIKLVILELPKIPETADSTTWPWLRFFKCSKKEEFEMLSKKHPELKKTVSSVKIISFAKRWHYTMLLWKIKKNPEFKKVVYCVRKISFAERWRHTMLLWQMQKMDENSMKMEWKEKGLKEGRAEGREKGKAEGMVEKSLDIARKLLAEGSTPEFAQKITGLSIDTIKSL